MVFRNFLVTPVERVTALRAGTLFALLVGTLLAWGVSSPPGSSPDEDYHLVSSWCAYGEREDACLAGSDSGSRIVPQATVEVADCFRFNEGESAACQLTSLVDIAAGPDTETERGNFDGSYPPGFYAVMGLLVIPDSLVASVLVMRMFNIAIFVSVAIAAVLLVPGRLRIPLVGGLAASAVPLTLFLIPSVNPSSWAIFSVPVFFVTALAYVQGVGHRGRSLALGALALVSAALGITARGDSAAFIAMSAVITVFLGLTAWRSAKHRFVIPVLAAAAGAITFLQTSQTEALSTGLPGQSLEDRLTNEELIGQNLVDLPFFLTGVFGTTGLGWLDTAMPPLVWVSATIVYSVIVMHGLGVLDWRKAVAASVVALAMVVLPMYLFWRSNALVGALVQPRYILPLTVLFAVVALLPAGARLVPPPAAATRYVLAAILSAANSAALFTNLRRYTTGVDVVDPDLNVGVEWWWLDGIVTPNGVWLLGSVAFGALVFALAYFWPRTTETHPQVLNTVVAPGNESAPEAAPPAIRGEGAKSAVAPEPSSASTSREATTESGTPSHPAADG